MEQFHDGYANLAAAILKSAKKESDQVFLKSDWAETLRYMCRLDDEMYGDRTCRVTRGVVEQIGG